MTTAVKWPAMYTCPVCYYEAMTYPLADYNICECCGTEFGADDDETSHAELRSCWIRDGMIWFFQTPPNGWDPLEQLNKYGVTIWPSTFPS